MTQYSFYCIFGWILLSRNEKIFLIIFDIFPMHYCPLTLRTHTNILVPFAIVLEQYYPWLEMLNVAKSKNFLTISTNTKVQHTTYQDMSKTAQKIPNLKEKMYLQSIFHMVHSLCPKDLKKKNEEPHYILQVQMKYALHLRNSEN